MDKDPYEVLGIEQTAGAEEIRRAFRGLAKEHHPDRAGDSNADRFREIRGAYDILSDPDLREVHDERRADMTVQVRIVTTGHRAPRAAGRGSEEVQEGSARDEWGEPVHIGRQTGRARGLAPSERSMREERVRRMERLTELLVHLLRW